jgi:hypothetical protein
MKLEPAVKSETILPIQQPKSRYNKSDNLETMIVSLGFGGYEFLFPSLISSESYPAH